ncbi:MAG: AbrB/MazE/SpoVT family DNA-binding domain-containing protein [Hyellaceae cyanobacterium CSU_1_1]|nr:AbrB/MazE/SpoVT family DNA-binding domain-containing protein [Hyellaceae cyanobacterium CSU_1_1]
MKKIVTINDRGTITLPKDLREKYGLEAGGKIVIEESEEGLLLHPGVTFSVEIYGDNRLKEFAEQNEAELEEFDLEQGL